MAQRDLTNFREVTQVVAENPSQFMQMGAEIGANIIRQGQEAKINENISKVQLDLNALQTQYQIDFEADPLKGMEEYKQKRAQIFEAYGEGISPLFKKPWNDSVRDIATRNDATQQGWVLKQTRINTVKSINQSIKNNMRQANMDGQNFGNSDETEVGAYVNFEGSKRQLAGWGNKNLGETTTTDMLSDYDRDYMKSFITGVADSNPKKAAEMLASDQMKGMFTSNEVDTLENVIKKSAKRKEIGSLFSQMETEDAVTELVLSPEGDYFSKRLEIDTLELEGKITDSAATKARRVLTSQKNADAITNTPKMSEIVNQMYDLNAIADTNKEDYLIGVQNIRERIIDDQANGDLTPEDAKKLNNQLRTLTAQKASSASQSVGWEFSGARDSFDILPPEYRGQATRELFYRGHGQDFSEAQYQAEANKIIDEIRLKTRKDTVRKVENITMKNNDFLQTTVNKSTGKPYTMDDVNETAKAHGMTPQEVIDYLKANQK